MTDIHKQKLKLKYTGQKVKGQFKCFLENEGWTVGAGATSMHPIVVRTIIYIRGPEKMIFAEYNNSSYELFVPDGSSLDPKIQEFLKKVTLKGD